MKKYVFLTADIYPLGGIQIYVSGKVKYLEKMGWKVFVYFGGFGYGDCVFPKLNAFRQGNIRNLLFLPNQLSNYVVNKTIKHIKKHIDYDSDDEIYIESHYDITALWGELLAKELNAKHVCLCCNEIFRASNKHYEEFIEFFKFKYDRNELAGITEESMKYLFEGYYAINDSEQHSFEAAADESVQDIDNETVNKLKKYDYNISYIGRVKKGYFQTISREVKEFCKKYQSKIIQYIVVGDADGKDKQWLSSLFEDINNVVISYTGSLVPVPRELFKKIDVTIAGSGCACLSALEGVPTILIDANDYKSNGLLGYDTNNWLYRDLNGKSYSIFDSLVDCLINESYKKKKFRLESPRENSYYYDKHFEYFKGHDKEYYPGDKILKPKRYTLKLIAKVFYYNYLKDFIKP